MKLGDAVRGKTFRSFVAGGAAAAVPVAFTIAAGFPARRALATREADYGRSFAEYCVGGIVADLAGVLPLVILALAVPAWALLLGRRFRRLPRSRAFEVVALLILPGLLVATAWLFSVGAAEFKIQRGLYPSWFETAQGLSEPSFILGSLPTLTLARYLVPNVLFLATLGAGLWLRWRLEQRVPAGSRVTRELGFAAASLMVVAAAGALLIASSHVFPTVDHRRELYPPVVTLYKSLRVQQKTAIFRGLRGVLATAKSSPEQRQAGAAALGYGKEQLDALQSTNDCAHHPLARALPASEGTLGGSAPTPLVASLEDLSRQLFAGRTDDLTIWQIAVESYRGNDIHGVQSAAPIDIAPFTSSLYEQSASDHVIAFPHAWQGGQRTSQAISGLLCGLGAMPFNLAVSRDLGYVPLRCLPDVLADAGFRTQAIYGSDMSFDNMVEFFRYHGVRTKQRVDFPTGLPTGTWNCITDWPVLAESLRRSEAEPGSQYNFVLSLAGHTPFDEPSDMPAEVLARLDRGIAASGRNVGRDDRKRLVTIAYSDWALQRFLAAVDASPAAARTIVVLSADHATGDPFLWGPPTIDAGSRIPLAIWLPRAFIERAPDPAAARRQVVAVNALSATTAVSANDVSVMLLSLISASRQLAGIAPAWRWSTIGGFATSADFALTGGARLWGIDASSTVFAVAPERNAVATGTGERAELFTDASQLDHLGPILGSAGALLSTFLGGWASRCTGPENIRQTK